MTPQRASAHFMLRHPAHAIALGFGSGLSPRAPGTVGTLWAWAAFVLLERSLGPLPWAALLLAGLLLGVWACTLCARHMGVADPGSIVWDEIIAFWAVLWLIAPAAWWV
ncbi:MAG: phosphatidylglycerophosphatase A, partial [Burkholderiaceae bacterium]|nr:phosphatidylglycerophosphatase A [Burkholderiaceae bacterium]